MRYPAEPNPTALVIAAATTGTYISVHQARSSKMVSSDPTLVSVLRSYASIEAPNTGGDSGRFAGDGQGATIGDPPGGAPEVPR